MCSVYPISEIDYFASECDSSGNAYYPNLNPSAASTNCFIALFLPVALAVPLYFVERRSVRKKEIVKILQEFREQNQSGRVKLTEETHESGSFLVIEATRNDRDLASNRVQQFEQEGISSLKKENGELSVV